MGVAIPPAPGPSGMPVPFPGVPGQAMQSMQGAVGGNSMGGMGEVAPPVPTHGGQPIPGQVYQDSYVSFLNQAPGTKFYLMIFFFIEFFLPKGFPFYLKVFCLHGSCCVFLLLFYSFIFLTVFFWLFLCMGWLLLCEEITSVMFQISSTEFSVLLHTNKSMFRNEKYFNFVYLLRLFSVVLLKKHEIHDLIKSWWSILLAELL